MHHFAFGNHDGGGGQNFKRTHRADFHHHAERLTEQEIAHEHARLIAPQHPRSELAAAHFAVVNNVVMQKRRGMHELDGGREPDMPFAAIVGERRGRKREHGPKPFAARGNQVVRDFRNHGDFGARAAHDQVVHPREIGTHEV